METNPPKDEIQQQVEQIVSAGALGKSEAYPRLLRYLGEKAQTGKSVKEIEIAIDVFGRDETFDVTQDSLIRVYIHKLRQKLDNFYNSTDVTYAERLVIPKGSYLLQLQRNQIQQESAPESKWRPNKRIAAVVVLSMAVALLGQLGLSYFLSQLQTSDAAIASPLWSPLSESNNQLLVVVGDQFIYSQVTEEFEQLREIRDFSIASPDDFQQRLNSDPDFALRYRDFGVRYLPSALAPVLKDFSEFGSDIPNWQVVLASQIDEQDLSEFNILYLGYFTALNKLTELAFENSSLQLHPNGSLLIQEETGEVFVGTGQLGSGYRDRYLDYGVFRKVSLESGNTAFLLMSARDPGLENLASFVFSDEGTAEIVSRLDNRQEDFEILLEVSGTGEDDLISQIRLTQQ